MILLRFFARLLISLIVLSIVLYLAILGFNLKDDELQPEVAKLLQEQPSSVLRKENGYFAWLGIMGPADKPAHAWGFRWFQAMGDWEKETIQFSKPAEFLPADEVREEAFGNNETSCRGKLDSCLERVAAAAEPVRAMLAKHQITLERADQAMALPKFQEILLPNYLENAPKQPVATELNNLFASRFALTVFDGNDAQALAQLDDFVSFHLRLLDGSSSMTVKMAGITALKTAYSLISQYIERKPDAARRHLTRIQTIIGQSLTDSAKLHKAILDDQRILTRKLLSQKEMAKKHVTRGDYHLWLYDTLRCAILLPKATANETFTIFSAWLAAEKKEGVEYRQAIALLKSRKPVEEQLKEWWANHPRFWHNPLGNLMAQVGAPDYSRLFLHRDNCLAMQRLLMMQLEILQEPPPVSAETVTAMITSAGREKEHPYYGTLLAWDNQRKRPFFRPTAQQTESPDILALAARYLQKLPGFYAAPSAAFELEP